jgi:carbamoyltransferase
MEYFNFCTGLTMTNERFHSLFGGPPRAAESEISQRDMDVAASIQVVVEEVVIRLARFAAKITQEKYLCLAGGVALNCVANGKLLRERLFDKVWVQPAAGDAGGALGAAFVAHHIMSHKPREAVSEADSMKGAFLGPIYSQSEISEALKRCQAVFSVVSENELIDLTAKSLASGKTVGWFNGRMEFGPRALGGRSILADPRSPSMQKMLNMKVKFRESFRPFAPCILREDLEEWFDIDVDSPYMLYTAMVQNSKRKPVREDLLGFKKLNVDRSEIPAVTHVDYSARVQTVHFETNPLLHRLLRRFKELTGCPLLVNTSFNVRGEPIVCTPEDAFNCFLATDLDFLAIGQSILLKEKQHLEVIRHSSRIIFND